MNRNKAIKFLILTGTALVATLFLLTVIKMYDDTLNDAKKDHEMQQVEMAKAATTGIKFYLKNLVEDMYLLSYYPKVQNFNEKSIRLNTDNIFMHYSEKIVRTIFVVNKNARIIYSKGREIPGWVFPEIRNVSKSSKKIFSKESCWYSKVEPGTDKSSTQKFSFVMLIPIRKGHDKPGYEKDNSDISGLIGYLVNFDLLMKQFIAPLKLSEGDFAWVMDGRGRLIYHPRHREMLLNSIFQKNATCLSCHKSFTLQKKMLSGQDSTGEYVIGEEPPKIMASTPLQLSNERWILAISTLLPQVTESLRGRFNLFFGLGIVILLVIFSFGFLLYYINAKRIRAEESNRMLEQRQHFQDQLNQAAKLASVGELVDTVAHEINTPLGVISSYTDALLMQKDYPEKYREDLTMIKSQTKRAGTYTRSLLGYSQRMPFNPQPVSISNLIEECLYLLAHRLRTKRAKIIKNYKPGITDICVDRGQLEQVIINLLNNAIDALDTNGQIKIDVFLKDNELGTSGNNTGKFVRIKITDNGIGISPGNLELIFEPFFTTKSANEGTGLGLSISRAIINRHKGKITVQSVPGKFTAFEIALPLNNEGEC